MPCEHASKHASDPIDSATIHSQSTAGRLLATRGSRSSFLSVTRLQCTSLTSSHGNDVAARDLESRGEPACAGPLRLLPRLTPPQQDPVAAGVEGGEVGVLDRVELVARGGGDEPGVMNVAWQRRACE